MKISKLNGPLNPKIIRKNTKYIIIDKFPDEQIYEESVEFIDMQIAYMDFLNSVLDNSSLLELLTYLNVHVELVIIDKAINSVSKICDADELIEYFVKSYVDVVYGTNTILLLKLLVNHWLLNNGYSMIIFYPSYLRGFDQLIAEGADNSLLEKMVQNFYRDTYYKNNVSPIKTLEDITSHLLSMKMVLNNQFGILKLSIFGSYAKNKQCEYSDLDLVIQTKEKMGSFQLQSIDDYLTATIGITVNSVTDGTFIKDKVIIEVF
ncbi:MAG: nucleotidyltransferase domain-containing protein [Acholeplasma sp.]|nr:nucleotidyltransferase domain-containing protein [Acholeplasma sp.]